MARKSSPTPTVNPSQDLAQTPITPRMVTIKQAAAYCSCSVWAIRDVIWSRELHACKIGRRYLIDRKDLDRFIDARLRERAS
jgi:excisionase family DNA binding protein